MKIIKSKYWSTVVVTHPVKDGTVLYLDPKRCVLCYVCILLLLPIPYFHFRKGVNHSSTMTDHHLDMYLRLAVSCAVHP